MDDDADTDESEAGSKSNDNSYLNWQQITKKPQKRNLSESPKRFKNKRQVLRSVDVPSTSNRFSVLQNNDDDNDDDEEITAPKPPPIYIPDVTNVYNMISNIYNIIPQKDFNYKSLRNNQIRLMISTIDSYRKIIKYLEGCNIGFHTYQLKQERSYRVILKGLHHSTPPENIKSELLLLGHQVRSVTNIQSRISKEPLPMFFVDLDPNPNNKEIFELKTIQNAIINVEPPRKKTEVVQCHRCQLFGHTKSYCNRPFNCVKCGLNHPTAECPKDVNMPARCFNCLKSHTSNYRGCQVYQNLINKRLNNRNTNNSLNNHANFSATPNDFPQLGNRNIVNENINQPTTTQIPTNNQSYSDVLQNNNNYNNNVSSSSMDRIEAMLGNLMDKMITMLISKLCK